MKTTGIRYELSDTPNCSYAQSGYSQYHKRLSMADRKEIPYSKVYGIAEAIEHANELRHSVYEGKKIRLKNTFKIRKIITKEIVVKTLLPVT